jgi:hypothetical protein
VDRSAAAGILDRRLRSERNNSEIIPDGGARPFAR